MAAEVDPRDQIFYGIHFTIIPSDDISDEYARKLQQLLTENGAEFRPLRDGGDIDDVTQHTHIISTHIDFPEYDSTFDANCNVVKPTWVENSIIKKRLAQPRQYSPDPALIFRDVVVTFGDLPQSDKDAITAGVLAMGGLYSPQLTKLVTHIVTNSEDSDVVRVVKEHNLAMKVVLPHWFDDCLKLGKKIGERPYTFPDPEIFNLDSFDVRRVEPPPDLVGATTATAGAPPNVTPPPSSPGVPAESRRKLSAFKGKKIFMAEDLNVHDQLASTLAELISLNGAVPATSAEDCDVYIGHYRDGRDYIKASQARKTVGNLAWFYSVITRDRWSNPLNRLLHYPIPRHGFPGFAALKVCPSNYTGDARTYLQSLITFGGGEFTKALKQDNTHLVTAHKKSEKCEAAEEWNLHIVNHLWLEESYAKCSVQSVTNPRFVHFPPRTNLSEIVGQTSIDIERVEEMYFPQTDDGVQSSATNVALQSSGRKATPASKANGLLADHQRTPSAQRQLPTEKENQAPPTGRASKMKAAANLEKAALDIAEFEKESKRKGGVTHGRKRNSDSVDVDDATDGSTDPRDAASRLSKKQKTKDVSDVEAVPVLYKMLITGEERWAKKPKKEAEDRKLLRSLGIQVVTDPTHCTLLCAPRILRTRKFVMAIAAAPTVVNTGYLDHALKHKSLQDTSAYGLQDREMEAKYSIALSDSLKRAQDNNRKLLRGWTIYVTDKVAGGFETYKDIVEANGGIAVPYRGRTGVPLPRRRLKIDEDPEAGLESQNQGGDQETEFVYLVSGTSDEEKKIWSTFEKMAEKQGLQARVVKADWVLNAAMAQRVTWDESWDLQLA